MSNKASFVWYISCIHILQLVWLPCHPLCIYSVVSLSDRVKNEQLKALNRGEDISRVVVYLFLILSLIQVAVFV